MELQTIFGTNLRNQRKARGLTQEALAERVEVSIETIGKIERGVSAPSFSTAERIAASMDIPVISLFGADDTVLPPGRSGKASDPDQRNACTDE